MKNAFKIDEHVSADAWVSYPSFNNRLLRAIEMAVRRAWDNLHSDMALARQLSAAKNENDISQLLRTALNRIREGKDGTVPGYGCYDFEHPQVGPEVLTPMGKIRKPDIIFHLAGPPRPGVAESLQDAIFIECKLLEHGNNKNVAAYCKNGIARFVEGSYGGWMRHGMMLAYARTTQALPDDLGKEISKPKRRKDLASDGELKRCTLTHVEPPTYVSVHQRNWSYIDGSGQPGPIEVRHLWLRV